MTAQAGLVSVVMPVYNGGQYLHDAIRSMLAQDYGQWELVVVDDGSTDDTKAIVQAVSDPRIRYTYQRNRGQAAALNRGLELARGEYVTTLDADDAYTTNSLGDRVAYLEKNAGDGAVYGDGNYCDETGEPFMRFSQLMPNGVCGDVFGDVIVSPFFGTGASVMVRKGVIEATPLRYDESIVWCQDWDFYIRLAALTNFGYVDSITIHYRIHGEAMTVAMGQDRRMASLIRMRMKVMTSARFNAVSVAQRAQFFYDFLVKELSGHPQEQRRVIDSVQFRTLPADEQGRLLRLAAAEYLLRSDHIPLAKEWLRTSWRRTPLNAKSLLLASSSILHPRLARFFVKARRSQTAEHGLKSPFEMPVAAGQPPREDDGD